MEQPNTCIFLHGLMILCREVEECEKIDKIYNHDESN